ncbi:unnamed protein product [Linum tenue]|uniref:DUF4283 domain-containing protein n=1 Tax=Linum tenue TaxID=586396 RepID=A0AAV0Q9J0_9ROSI|nr:unnamed protein product [Linum tenue]
MSSSLIAMPADSSIPSGRPPDNCQLFTEATTSTGAGDNPLKASTGDLLAGMQIDKPPAPTNLGLSPTGDTIDVLAADTTGDQTSTSPSKRIVSYAGIVAGEGSMSKGPMSQWIPVGEHDLIPGSFQGEPELRLSDNFKTKLSAPWQRTLVVRLLGRNIGYTTLCNRIRALWRPSGSMEVLALF